MHDVFHSGEVIEFGIGKAKQTFRVYTRCQNTIVLFPMPENPIKAASHGFEFRGYTVESLRHDFLSGGTRIVADQFVPAPAPAQTESAVDSPQPTLEDQEWAKRVEAVEYVLLPGDAEHAMKMVAHKFRQDRVDEAVEEFGFTIKTMQRMVSRYLTYGMTAAALRKFTWKMGKSDKKRETKRKLGRRCRFHDRGRRSGCNITPEIRVALCPFVYAFYEKAEKNGQKAKLRDIYKAFIIKKYKVGRSGGPKDMGNIMSFSNFKSTWYRLRHATKASIAQHGKKHHRDHREKIGSEAALTPHAGFLFQADFTIPDIELVHPIYRQDRPLGRPYGGLVADIYSSAMVGLDLSLGSLNARSGLRLLGNAFSDKTKLLKAYHLDPAKYPIPGGFLPVEVYVDNGELRGEMKRIIPDRIKVRFTNSPPYRPDLKGTIESMINRLFGHKIHLLDGFNPPGRKRGDRHPMDGVLDLAAFRKIVLMAMGMCNRELIAEKYIHMAAIRDKIPGRPIRLWNHSIEESFGILRKTPDEEILAFLTLPQAKAQIHGDKKGLEFRGRYYFNEQLVNSGAIIRAGKSGSLYVNIAYDPDLVDVIYLIEDANRWLIQPLFLSDRSAFLRNRRMTFADADGIQEEKDLERLMSEEPDLFADIVDYDKVVEDIVADQRARNKFAKDKPFHSLPPATKKESRKQVDRAEKQQRAKVLTNPGSEKGKIIQMPGAAKATASKPTTAAQRNIKQLYQKIL